MFCFFGADREARKLMSVSVFSQLHSTQNTPYVSEAYFRVARSDPFTCILGLVGSGEGVGN